LNKFFYVIFKFIKLPIDETRANFSKQNTQPKGKRRNKLREPKIQSKKQNPKWVTKDKGTIMFQSPTNDIGISREKKT
jgi:hypothetical protein